MGAVRATACGPTRRPLVAQSGRADAEAAGASLPAPRASLCLYSRAATLGRVSPRVVFSRRASRPGRTGKRGSPRRAEARPSRPPPVRQGSTWPRCTTAYGTPSPATARPRALNSGSGRRWPCPPVPTASTRWPCSPPARFPAAAYADPARPGAVTYPGPAQSLFP